MEIVGCEVNEAGSHEALASLVVHMMLLDTDVITDNIMEVDRNGLYL